MSWRLEHGDCVEILRSIEESSVDAIVTDPPYGIGFMGHGWDQPGEHQPLAADGGAGPLQGGKRRRNHPNTTVSFGGPPHPAMEAGLYDLSRPAQRRYQAWCEAWAVECLRVLKPGGHLASFGGTRTYHRLACAIEDAGFEVRDCLAWLYGSGFPKSLDVTKAIDKLDAAAERDERAKRSQAWLRKHVTPKQVNEATDTGMGNHLTTHPTQPFVPTPAMLAQLRPLLPKVPRWLERLVEERAVESANMAAREVVGERAGTTAPGVAGDRHRNGEPTSWEITRAHTEDARRWDGWGTALKPAHEPIVLARKPLAGTVAATVLAHGTGALNVDGCRVDFRGEDDEAESKGKNRHADFGSGARENCVYGADERARGEHGNYDAPGRWPANVLLDPEAAAMVDEQTEGVVHGAGGAREGSSDPAVSEGSSWLGTRDSDSARMHRFGDSGGASRFFYCAKASSGERNAGLHGLAASAEKRNVHPTVKPIDLMRWLVRLITPPGGVVLDPFTGSGTTGCAAVLEGFEFVGIEREDEYRAIADARIAWWAEHPEGVALVAAIDAARARLKRADEGQLDLLGGVA